MISIKHYGIDYSCVTFKKIVDEHRLKGARLACAGNGQCPSEPRSQCVLLLFSQPRAWVVQGGKPPKYMRYWIKKAALISPLWKGLFQKLFEV